MVHFIELNKTTKLVTKSPIGWFYECGRSVKHLHNFTANTLAIIIPNADCHMQIKLSGTSFKNEETLHKLYSSACKKYGIKNIFE